METRAKGRRNRQDMLLLRWQDHCTRFTTSAQERTPWHQILSLAMSRRVGLEVWKPMVPGMNTFTTGIVLPMLYCKTWKES